MFEVQLIIQSKQKMRSERTVVVSKVLNMQKMRSERTVVVSKELNMLRDYWTWT